MKNLKIINYIKYSVWGSLFILFIYTLILGIFNYNQCFNFFKFTFFEAIYLFLTLLNIILLIELYNFFSKSMNENEKKDNFILKMLEYISVNLLAKELVELNNEDDYKKYLLTTKNIKNRLILLKNISESHLNKNILKKIDSIKISFEKYCDLSSEYIQNYASFNSQKLSFEKSFEQINFEIIEIQALILKFEM